MKRVTLIALAAATISACAGSPEPSDTTPTSAPPSTEQPSLYKKAVGQEGGWACVTRDNSTCSVAFTVTGLTAIPESQCNEYADHPEGTRLIEVSIDVRGQHPTPAPNAHIEPGFVVSSDNWYGLGSDGYSTKADIATACGDMEPGPFYHPVGVGQKARGSIIFAIPDNSTAIELHDPVYQGIWRWMLPSD